MLYVGTLDQYVMALDGGIVQGGKVISVIESRTQLAAHLRRDLEALGLERRHKVKAIGEILNEDEQSEAEQAEAQQ